MSEIQGIIINIITIIIMIIIVIIMIKGDMERLQLNITPMGMMDRDRKDELPEMQVHILPLQKFLDQVDKNIARIADAVQCHS